MEPIKVEEENVKISELDMERQILTAEMDLTVDHIKSGHNITLSMEQNINNFWSRLLGLGLINLIGVLLENFIFEFTLFLFTTCLDFKFSIKIDFLENHLSIPKKRPN